MSTENRILSAVAANVSPSPTLAVDSKAKALKASGEDVCGFGSGEPDFDTPEFIKEACANALAEGQTKYIPAAGLPVLREALASKYVSENGIAGLEPVNVVVNPGGKYSCFLAIQATCGPGDEVIIPAPYWVSYPEMVKLAGAEPKVIFAGDDQGFKITADQLRESITDRSRMLILNSPSNPTGAIYDRQEMEAIMEVVLEHGLYVMSDEIYEYLLYDDVTHHSPASFSAEAADKVITVAGFSKTYSMTGWRLGTLVASAPVAKAVASIQSQTTSNATTFAQYGALAALERSDEAMAAVAEMLTHFDRRRLFLLDSLNAIDGVSCPRAQGAFYLFPNVSSLGIGTDDLADRLLDDHKVAVVPGSGFGAEGYIRLSYATSDEVIEKGVARFQEFCANL